jgi:hypothetical protein
MGTIRPGESVAPERDSMIVEAQLPQPAAQSRSFSFHGVGVRVESDDPRVLDLTRHAFAWFESEVAEPELRITHRATPPDYDALPELTSSVATPRNICFAGAGVNYIDYFGRALNVYDPRAETAHVTCEDPDLAREIVFLTVLSRVAARLAKRGLHRIHALGLERGGHGALVLLPSGGGKSTLALAILRRPENGLRLIAEDSPLLDRDGSILPFPLRIGVHPHRLPADIDPRFTRREERMEFDAKTSIDVTLFADRLVDEPVAPGLILLGRRTTARDARIVPVARRRVGRHILMNSVVGIGLYQGLEFILQKGLGDVFAHAVTALSRSRNNFHLVRKSKVYEFEIGRDLERNYEVLVSFLAERLGSPPALR